ncbi:MAG: restriction endonuclease subunit S [Lachnospiraceae bacterium]|nr:restriction endonuclease subunit S [Lachnospiraceae bacterium]MCM1231325.1 restriction endonuclease subunit S [Ruminococcus flavefaciens]
MLKLNKLINELCPNGVEYKKLCDVTEMKRGTSEIKKDLQSGNIPVISGGKKSAFYCNKNNRDGETITVAGNGAGAGYVQYWDILVFINDAFSVKGNEKLMTKYIFYFLSGIQDKIYSTKKGGGIPHVHISSIENFLIPVPPIEIQREIATRFYRGSGIKRDEVTENGTSCIRYDEIYTTYGVHFDKCYHTPMKII